jgi:hypothetical protein
MSSDPSGQERSSQMEVSGDKIPSVLVVGDMRTGGVENVGVERGVVVETEGVGFPVHAA